MDDRQLGTGKPTGEQMQRPPGDNPPPTQAGTVTSEYAVEMDDADKWMVDKARRIYQVSTDYLDANITNQWERNLAHFHGEHAPGSPMANKSRKRSRTFRPKTRAAVKAHEAALAVAAFASQELLLVRAADELNEEQRISAQINKNILQFRLEEKMPWFLTAIGGFQDTKNYGLCISFQYWRYEHVTDLQPALDDNGKLQFDEDGRILGKEVETVMYDEPCCDLLAPENFKFSPTCDWRDPARTSPYLIYEMPLHIDDVLDRMEKTYPKTGEKTWRKYTKDQILAGRRKAYDRTRWAREGRERIDPTDDRTLEDYTLVWAHLNIVREHGVDVAFWTLGTELPLTEPQLLSEMFPHLAPGERPFVVGYSTIEAHRNYPAGDVEQSASLQQELNAIANQRMDNVKLVLNKRYHVRRGAQVDLEALIRNVAGGGVMMTDPEKDVKVIDTPDVTRSSYVEQDKLSTEMDELLGSFGADAAEKESSGTQGGMSTLQQTSGAVKDYGIRIFTVTWMEPVLRQLLRLVQMYETDEMIITQATRGSELFSRFGLDYATDELLRQNLLINVDVGIGNTDPVRRVERLVFGISQTLSLPGMIERVKSTEIADEIFGALGYRASARFFMDDEEFAKHQEANPPKENPEIELQRAELEMHTKDNDMRHERELKKIDSDHDIRMSDVAMREKTTIEKVESMVGIASRKDQTAIGIASQRDQTARDTVAAKETNRTREINVKQATGSGS